MSEVSVKKIAKPQLRGLLNSQIKRTFLLVGVGWIVALPLLKTFVYDERKRAYADFYKTYDVDKEFETMRKKGLFDSCSADD